MKWRSPPDTGLAVGVGRPPSRPKTGDRNEGVPEERRGATAPVLPEAESVTMAELAADVQEGLLAMAVGAGLQVMVAIGRGYALPESVVPRSP